MQTLFADLLIDLSADPVGTDDNSPLRDAGQLLFPVQHPDSLFLQIPDHHLIVNDGTICIDGPHPLLRLFIDRVHRPLNAETKPCAPGHLYLHSSLILSTTSWMVMSEESRSTASSA